MTMRRLPTRLGAKVLALLLLASALPVGVAAIITFLRARSLVEQDATKLLSARTDQLVSELEGFHRNYLGATRRMARIRSIGATLGDNAALPANAEAARQILQSYVSSDPQIRSAALYDTQGRAFLNTDEDLRTRSRSPANKSCFRSALKGQTAVADIFLFEGSDEPLPMISYCAPIYDWDGTTLGVAVLFVRASAFWDAVRAGNGRAGPDSFSVLYDASGIRIAHSATADELFRPGGPLPAAEIDAAIVEQRFGDRTMTLLASPSVMIEEFTRARAPLLSEQDVFRGYSPNNGQWNLGVARRLHSVPWTLISLVPESQLARPAQSLLLSTIFASMVIMAGALIIGLFGAQRILSPINTLAKAAESIARGDKEVSVHITARDELGVLGQRFNQMAAAIDTAQRNLEARVRERTIELERVNSELQSQKGELLAQQDELRAQQAELEEKNQEVAHANRLKSEFLTNMSHELRTPLNSIIGFSELVLGDVGRGLSTRHQSFLENVLSSGQHLLRLINDILDLSKIEAGHSELDLMFIEPGPAVGEACTLLSAPAAKKQLRLVQDCQATQGVRADAGKLRQVLLNLLSNAVKFSPEGSQIEVGTQDGDDCVAFSVRDHGPGIEPQLLPRLFRPFVQGENPINKQHAGTGLGLAISRRLVEQHGGRLDVETVVGKGSVFRFTLPAMRRTPPAERGATRSPQRPVVLVLEDDPVAAPELRTLLEHSGYRVSRVDQDSDELELATQIKPAAIVLNPALEKRDAIHLLDALKRRPATLEIPVVLTSAPGARGFLAKPIEQALLIKNCENAVAHVGDKQPIVVLGIDDDPRVGVLLRSILEPAGYRVHTTLRGEDGLKEARRQPPDLVIVDLAMPDISGFEVIEALAADPRTRACPVIVMTAAELSENDRSRLRRHARALAEKGNITRAELLAAVSRAIGQNRVTTQLPRMPQARVLVVDDHDLNRELARSILEAMGHTVLLAEDGEQAVQVAQKERPDIILMDMAMPKLDGYSATRRLKADPQTASIPIIALTAQAMRGDEEKAYASGVDGYLTKPLERGALTTTISRWQARVVTRS